MGPTPTRHIGVTGYNASGKGEVTRYLVSLGFESVSLSDLLREEARSRGLESSRENLIQLGQALRRERGPGFLAEKAIQKNYTTNGVVIDSIRHPEEINILRSHFPGFFLIGVDAPLQIRFQRSVLRGRKENASTVTDFEKLEKSEATDDPTSQQLHRCMAMADQIIVNDRDVETLRNSIDKVLTSLA